MSYLLDTSSFLWFVYDDRRLSALSAELLESSSNAIYLSLASIWEIAIKVNLGRGLELRQPFSEFMADQLDTNCFQLLNINISHLKKIADMPHIHRDHFDGLLIAQSLVESIPILTNDAAFDDYAVQRIC